LMVSRLPRGYALSPYTTLFRSQVTLTERLLVERAPVDGRPAVIVRPSEQLIRERQEFAIQQNTTTLRNRVNELSVSEPVVQQQGDRKSTRLNSSHVKTSYAVFC